MNILITGSSTGIGWDIADSLSNKGHKVFAGVRSQNDFDKIKSLNRSNLIPLYLDVSNDEQIDEAMRKVQEILEGQYLDVLINNAGIVESGPLESISRERVFRQFDVNVLGLIKMIQATLVDLKVSKGKIINIGSVSGYVSWPFSSLYCASKHAVSGLTKSLRLELDHLGIQATTIAPGAVKTPLWDKTLGNMDEMINNNPDYTRQLHGVNNLIDQGIKTAVLPHQVTMAVEECLTSKRLKEVYIVGPNGKFQYILNKIMCFGIFEKFQKFLLKRGTPPS